MRRPIPRRGSRPAPRRPAQHSRRIVRRSPWPALLIVLLVGGAAAGAWRLSTADQPPAGAVAARGGTGPEGPSRPVGAKSLFGPEKKPNLLEQVVRTRRTLEGLRVYTFAELLDGRPCVVCGGHGFDTREFHWERTLELCGAAAAISAIEICDEHGIRGSRQRLVMASLAMLASMLPESMTLFGLPRRIDYPDAPCQCLGMIGQAAKRHREWRDELRSERRERTP